MFAGMMRVPNRRRNPLVPVAVLVLAGVLAVALAAVPTSGRERLQQLTRLPKLSFSTGMTFDAVHGYQILTAASLALRDLEDVRKTLAGNTSDAPRYARLARMLSQAGEEALAQRLWTQAADLYRQQGTADTQNLDLLLGYAEVLQAQSKREDAERLFRQAVTLGPEQWRTHAALARFLAGESLRGVTPAPWQGKDVSLRQPASLAKDGARPSAEQVEQARRRMAEAVREAERAVELDAQQAQAFSSRATVRTAQRFEEALLATSGDAQADFRRLNLALFNPEAVPDLLRTATLAGSDPQAWAQAALLDVLAEGFQRGLRQADDLLVREWWPVLPEKTRSEVREAMRQLETISQDREPRVAAAALTFLGHLQFFVLRDAAGGEANLRRATQLDPANDNAWETLIFALAYNRRFAPMLEACQERLKQNDTVRNRVLLAKAYEKNDQPDAMLHEAELAQRRYPENLLANLTLGAALLKAKDDELARARALQFLAKATQLAGDHTPPDVALEVLYQRGLYFALSGQSAVARTHFRAALQIDPDHTESTEALQALDQISD